MRCDLRSFPSIDNSGTQVFRCITHDWTVLVPIYEGYQCPVGRIEAARDRDGRVTDAALKKIEEALKP